MRKIPKSIIRDCVKNFFPRWKAWNDWRYEYRKLSKDIGGRCYRYISFNGEWKKERSGMIVIKPYADCQWDVELKDRILTVNGKDLEKSYLIHEMCHAVTGRSHDKKFFTRLEKCKEKAVALCDKKLADLIFTNGQDTKEQESDYEAYARIDKRS